MKKTKRIARLTAPTHIGPAYQQPCGFVTQSFTREQFESALANIEAIAAMITSQAYSLDRLTVTPDLIAHQIVSNSTVLMQIADLIRKSGVRIVYSESTNPGDIPFPPTINHTQTMINFDKHSRGII